jgi:hypothetical protein
MLVRFARCLVVLPVLAASTARAQGPAVAPPDAAAPPSVAARTDGAARTELVMGVTGALEPEARATLVRLLRAELEPHGMSLAEDDPRGNTGDWAREVTHDERRLLAVLLDTRHDSGWRLVVIDAARGRAISRELPRGERDAANVEAVVSIVLSAASALREGLEVASAPLDAIVGAPAPAVKPPPPARKKPRASSERATPRSTTLHASLAALAASFAEGAEPTFGASLALGASFASLVEVDVRGSRQLATSIESPFGSFELTRTSLALSAGPLFRVGSTPRDHGGGFALVPAAGAAIEWIHRAETAPAADVLSSDATTTPRIGGLLELRGRAPLVLYRGSESFSLVGTVGAAYFGERVRFLAGDAVLAEARRSSFYGELGLFIATGPL